MTQATLIDYGASNLHSVEKALEKAGFSVKVASKPDDVPEHAALVLPGQGHFGQVMQSFLASGFESLVREHIAAQKPFLGICVGLQLLMEGSEEAPNIKGLSVIEGYTKRFPETKDSIPQMGWNELNIYQKPSLLNHIREGDFAYFANSYYVDFKEDLAGSSTTYAGISFKSAISKGPLNATQFHPEKSQRVGLKILENFRVIAEQYLNT